MIRRMRVVVMVGGALFLAATAAGCSSNKSQTPVIPTPAISVPASLVPSAAVSDIASAQAALCQAIAQLRSTFAQLQASPGVDQSQVNGALDQASQKLRSTAQQLTSAGRSDLASFAQSAATSVDSLKQALAQSGGIAAAVQAAVAAASASLAQIPTGTCS